MAAFKVNKHGGGTMRYVVNRQNEHDQLRDQSGTVQAGAVGEQNGEQNGSERFILRGYVLR